MKRKFSLIIGLLSIPLLNILSSCETYAQTGDYAVIPAYPSERVDYGHLGEITSWDSCSGQVITSGTDSQIMIRENGRLLYRFAQPQAKNIFHVSFLENPGRFAFVYEDCDSGNICLSVQKTSSGEILLNQTLCKNFSYESVRHVRVLMSYAPQKETIYLVLSSDGCSFDYCTAVCVNDGKRMEIPDQLPSCQRERGDSGESLHSYLTKDKVLQNRCRACIEKMSRNEYLNLSVPKYRLTEATAPFDVLSPCKKWVAGIDENGTLDVWSTRDGKTHFTIQTEYPFATPQGLRCKPDSFIPFQELHDIWKSAVFSRSGKYLFLIAHQEIHIFDIENKTLKGKIQPDFPPLEWSDMSGIQFSEIGDVTISSDESIFYLTTEEPCRFYAYSLPKSELLFAYDFDKTLYDARFSEDGAFLFLRHTNAKKIAKYNVLDFKRNLRDIHPCEILEEFIPPPNWASRVHHNECPSLGSKTEVELQYPHKILHFREGKIDYTLYHFSPNDYLKIDAHGQSTGSPSGLKRLE